MSWRPTLEPRAEPKKAPLAWTSLQARRRSIGNLWVRRLLPSSKQRTIGPFVYMDHMGPHDLARSGPVDVPQHPHINLTTVTYLFEGQLTHRDSTGAKQVIRPGEINRMNAGRGVVHSERVPQEAIRDGDTIHGIQVWLGLPSHEEEQEPTFEHHPADSFPVLEPSGSKVRVLMGRFGETAASISTPSPTLYCDIRMETGSTLKIPPDYSERGLYIAQGALRHNEDATPEEHLLLLPTDHEVQVTATRPTRAVLLGGEPLDGERFIWWNFVSSRKTRIEQAARDWDEGRFKRIQDDVQDLLPMPAMKFPWNLGRKS